MFITTNGYAASAGLSKALFTTEVELTRSDQVKTELGQESIKIPH